ncbi:MAG: Fe-S cluster assembly protein SufD, partial [Candidatus Omnitrophica bacterium]|nr:Fe-S cluster assembly protein SufD [Candidatus Omnitrophota bacterium]
RTDVRLLDPAQGFAPTAPELLARVALSDAQLASFTRPLGEERLIVRVNGSFLSPPPAMDHLRVEELGRAAGARPEAIRRAIEADGLTDAEQKLASLNLAFHHDDVALTVAPQAGPGAPIRLVRIMAVRPQQAVFPLTVITIGAGSAVTLIDEYVSVPEAPGTGAPHLVNGRIEIVLEQNASLHYVRLQRLDLHAREFLLQRATLAQGTTLTMTNINLGSALTKAHVMTKLVGPGATAKLYGFVFGHGAQHIDQHTLQDHRAPNTVSDLQFRAALQDESRMIYTGLIRIAKAAQQTNAYQANHNLLLSRTARAETIPMLEILADDVQCKHGASTGPIDEEQAFYLMSRGIPRERAQRLIVMGFIEPIVQQVAFAPLQERLRRELEGSLSDGG